MRATSSTLDNNRIKLVVEVDDAEMDEALDAAAATSGQAGQRQRFSQGQSAQAGPHRQHRGTRRSCAPKLFVNRLPDFYARAISETMVDPIGQPDVTITAGEDEGMLVFEADVEVRPEITLAGYDVTSCDDPFAGRR